MTFISKAADILSIGPEWLLILLIEFVIKNDNKSETIIICSNKKFQDNEKERLDNLESEIGEIKSLLKALAERSI